MNHKPVIILGMHRGGTSLMAELVHRWGAYAGPPQSLVAADMWNGRGYWEFIPLVILNQNLLRAVASTGWHPPADEAQGRLEDYAESGPFRDEALRLLSRMQEPGTPWLWKDPRLAVLLPFWRRLWGEVVYVIPVRNPLDVAKSLTSRDRGASLTAAVLLWQRYMTSILRFTAGDRDRLFVEYESLIADSDREVSRLCALLNDHVRIEGGDVGHVLGGVDASLRHNASDREQVLTDSTLTPRQKELYKVFRRLVADPETQIPASSLLLPPSWREYLEDPRKEIVYPDRENVG